MEVALPSLMDSVIAIEKTGHHVTGYRGERKRILIVDDMVGNTAMLVSLLEPLGFELDTAQNGRDAQLRAAEHCPDLVLIDMAMPETDGLEAATLLRQNQSMAIIGASADCIQKEAFVAVCDDFVTKPIPIELLLEKIGLHLRLEWVTASSATAGEANGRESRKSEKLFVVPPPPEMEKLYELARMGDLLKIEAWATLLEARDNRYSDFAVRLRELAGGFKAKAILTLVEEYRGGGE